MLGQSAGFHFDVVLGIHAYQQTSTELMRLELFYWQYFCHLIWQFGYSQQLTGIIGRDTTLWEWVQDAGQQTIETTGNTDSSYYY